MILLIRFNEATRQHQNRIQKLIRERLSQIHNDILKPHGMKFGQVEIVTSHSNSIDEIENLKCEMIFLNSNLEERVDIRKIILFKDQHNISDCTCKKLKNDLNLNLPSLYELKAEISRCDQIMEKMENSRGVYINIIEKLKLLIPKI